MRTRIRSEKTSAASGALLFLFESAPRRHDYLPFCFAFLASLTANACTDVVPPLLLLCFAREKNKQISIRFLYDGTRINEEDTPATLDMEDNGQQPPPIQSLFFVSVSHAHVVPYGIPDTIDVMVERTSRFPTPLLSFVLLASDVRFGSVCRGGRLQAALTPPSLFPTRPWTVLLSSSPTPASFFDH